MLIFIVTLLSIFSITLITDVQLKNKKLEQRINELEIKLVTNK